VRVGILTLSTRAAQGTYEDRSGPLIGQFVQDRLGFEVVKTDVLPDEQEQISRLLIEWVDHASLDLILTTGGTGFAPHDVTPEATRAVIEREAPGLAEAMRAASLQVTPHAMLSRAVCGIRGRTLIINLPGNPKAVNENLEVLMPVLPHALELLTEAPGSEAGHRQIRQA
jgi:molybdenum cofactor synthesis domain-containing protein